MSYIPTLIIFALSGLLCNVFIALAINSDAKARDLKGRAVYVNLAIIFSFIVGIVYLCRRSKMQKLHPKMCNKCCNYVDENDVVCPYCSSTHFSTFHNDKSKKLKKASVIYLVIAIVLYITYVAVLNFSVMPLTDSILDKGVNDINSSVSDIEDSVDELSFYDMKGNAYSDIDNVIFYSKDGSQYVNIRDKNYKSFFVNTKDEKEKYDAKLCYVDIYGYFVYDKDDKFNLSDDFLTAKDSDGNIYYPAELATWNSRGELLN